VSALVSSLELQVVDAGVPLAPIGSMHAIPMALVAVSLALFAVPDARADVPALAPNLYEQGNLRISVVCAETFATPESGLHVDLDGAPLKAVGTNAIVGISTDQDGTASVVSAPTDVGYLAPPGPHHLRIESPDCVADDRDVNFSAVYAEHISGRLAIANPALLGPVGAPNSWGFGLGMFTSSYPDSLRAGVSSPNILPTSYSVDRAAVQGISLSSSVERRHLLIAADDLIGWGSIAGTAQALPSFGTPGSAPMAFTGSVLENSTQLRIGMRVPLSYVALAAGAGLGLTLWTTNSVQVSGGAAQVAPIALEGMTAMWDVPLWASATFKPSCNWGVQVLASYEVQPTDTSGNMTVMTAGLQWQPSASCEEPPGLTLTP